MERWRAELYRDELYHHGIKGMKWGVRRYQNPDGSYTSAGKRRYGIGDSEKVASLRSFEKNAKREYNKANNAYGLEMSNNNYKRLQKATNDYNFAKQDRQDQQVRERLARENGKKSKSRLKYEEQYKQQGMNADEAAIAAYKRERATKIALTVGAIAIASVAAYAGYKYYKNNVDGLIKSGIGLQNISKVSDKSIADAFYASYKSSDKMKYRGFMGVDHFNGTGEKWGLKNTVYNATIRATDNIKVASPNSAKKVLNSGLNSDNEFRKGLTEHVRSVVTEQAKKSPDTKLTKALSKAYENLKSGKELSLKDYEAINSTFSNRTSINPFSSQSEPAVEKFYGMLKKAGYGAVGDINDMKFSGYNSKAPVIVFDSSKVVKEKVEKLSESKMLKDYKRTKAIEIGKSYIAPMIAAYGGATVATNTAVGVLNAKQEQKMVREYKSEHPNTKLSYNEIVRMLKREQEK